MTGGPSAERSAPSSRALPRAIILDPSDNGPGMARSLQRHGVAVSILATPPNAWTACGRAVDGRVLGDLPGDTGRWLSVLRELGEQAEGVLIPSSDAACELVLSNRDRLPRSLKSFESRDSAHSVLMNKSSLHEIAARAGIAQPFGFTIRSEAELEEAARSLRFPCLLKPTLSHVWRRQFGEERAIVTRDPASLRAAAAPALQAGLHLLASDYIPGPVRNLETAVVVRSRDGTTTLRYTKRKLFEHPPLGVGTLHETCDVVDTLEVAVRLLDAAGFVGLASVETKRNMETGEVVLIEANVRVPQGFGLGDAAGLDASWRLYASLARLPLGPQASPREGVRLVVASRELPALADAARTPRELWRRMSSYRNVRDVSGLDFRDMGLMIAFLKHVAPSAVRRARRAV